ncbi:MAG: copper oxidase, partial [Chthoniobacterales bacterium]
MFTRRKFFSGAAAILGGSALVNRLARGAEVVANQSTTPTPAGSTVNYRPVVTPNGSTLPWTMNGGVKEFRLVAEPVKREFA